MPLKHFTETFLVVLLGAVIALTGLLTASLPHLPEGALPWVVLFGLSVVYPLLLLPMFRVRRADTFFRNLHWYPALILLVWLVLEGLLYKSVLTESAVRLFTWGWTLPAVALGFLMLVYYCLQVIRRRVPRIAFLALILIPFTAVAFFGERAGGSWDGELQAMLWGSDFWKLDSSSGAIALLPTGRSSEPTLDPSEDPSEEAWRERLREQERREQRVAERMKNRKDAKSDSSVIAMADSSASTKESVSSAKSASTSSRSAAVLSGTGDELRNAGTMPGKLPGSGLGWGVIVTALAAAYCASVQRSTQRRAEIL